MSSYEAIRPLLFRFDAETAHKITIGALHRLWAPSLPSHDERLAIDVAGIRFPTPVGLAAGFDKDAKAPGRMLGFGFGFVEVGTVTPLAQPGNPSPRAFRLKEDEAIINRFGFNSEGHDVVARRLRRRLSKKGIVGVNIGANKDSRDKIFDYVQGVKRFAQLASYLTINISSPNTPGLRSLQGKSLLRQLVPAIVMARNEAKGPPLFLKVSPDLNAHEIADVAEISSDGKIDALIVGNTTVARPSSLKSKFAAESGGLSGEPLKDIASQALRDFKKEVGKELPLIAAGGISSAEDAYERLKAGACLIQLYTALAYKGPGLASEIEAGLLRLMDRDGLKSISEAVGSSTPTISRKTKKHRKVGTELQVA